MSTTSLTRTGRRLDLRAGLERPQRLAVAQVDGVHQAAEVADVDRIGSDRRRRLANQIAGRVLPAELAGRQVEREQVAVAAADVDDAVRDRRRRVDRIARVVGPEKLERGGKGRCRDAGQRGRAAELSPLVGRCGTSVPARDGQRGDDQ